MRRGLRSWSSARDEEGGVHVGGQDLLGDVPSAEASPRTNVPRRGRTAAQRGRRRASRDSGSSASQSPTAGRSAALAAARVKRRWMTTSTGPSAVWPRIDARRC